MLRIIVICLAVTTFSFIDCKNTNTNPKTENPTVVLAEKMIIPQNETAALQKNNNITIAQQYVNTVKYDNLVTNRKPKTRQVSQDLTVTPTSMRYMSTGQSYYQSPLMMYPFPMMNTYYPRYFPYGPYGYLGNRGYGYHPFMG